MEWKPISFWLPGYPYFRYFWLHRFFLPQDGEVDCWQMHKNCQGKMVKAQSFPFYKVQSTCLRLYGQNRWVKASGRQTFYRGSKTKFPLQIPERPMQTSV